MKSNWVKVKLGDLIELIIDHRGKTPKKMGFEDFHAHGYPVLSAKHVKTEGLTNLDSLRFANDALYKKWMKEEVQEGDIILTSEAPLGELYYISGNEKYLLGQRVFGLRPKKELVNPLYLFSWLASKKGQNALYEKATGSTVQGIKQSELLKIDVFLPPRNIQDYIAKVTFSVAGKIKNNKEINQILEQMAHALFKSWFVDFEPVKAKIAVLEAGGSQEDATLAAMTAISGKVADSLAVFEREYPEKYAELRATAELFPSAMQESELGDIPAEWTTESYSTFCDFVQSGGTPKRSEQDYWMDGDIRWLSSGEVREKIVLDTKEKITSTGLKNSSAKLWPKHTTVMAMYGATAGEICLLAEDMSANQACCALYTKEYPFFTYYSLRNSAAVIASKASGSAQQNLNKGLIENAIFCKPKNEILSHYENTIKNIMLMWISNVRCSHGLSVIRDTLLPKLLSGEITLPEAEELAKGS